MKKYSKQREALLQELKSRRDHPTAEDLYIKLRETIPNYSLGTVYRNLADLTAEGVIMKIATGTGPEHYDGFPEPHGHFTCTCCNKVFDLRGTQEQHVDMPAILKSVENNEASDVISSVDEIRIMLYGKCKTCNE